MQTDTYELHTVTVDDCPMATSSRHQSREDWQDMADIYREINPGARVEIETRRYEHLLYANGEPKRSRVGVVTDGVVEWGEWS
jgi:hypothetical protein